MELKRLTVYSPFLCYFILEKIFISHCVLFQNVNYQTLSLLLYNVRQKMWNLFDIYMKIESKRYFYLLISDYLYLFKFFPKAFRKITYIVQTEKFSVCLHLHIYDILLKQYDKPKDHRVPGTLACLKDNMDIVVNLAEKNYYNCDFRECYKITTR